MKKILSLSAIILLSACASPTFQMTPDQVASLNDDQICAYKNNYRDETKLELEIARRNLNCNPYHRQCLSQGNQPGTQAMGFCEDMLRENERLRSEPAYGHYGFDMFGYRDYDRLRSVHHHH